MKISQAIFDKYSELAEVMLLENGGFGIKCKLVYTNKIEEIQTTAPQLKQKKMMNLQQTSPQDVFGRSNENFRVVEVSEDITLRIYWTQKDFKKFASISVPDGSIMTIGRYSDLQKVNKATSLRIQTAKTGHQEWIFEKSGEATIHGLDNNYFMCFWKRV